MAAREIDVSDVSVYHTTGSSDSQPRIEAVPALHARCRLGRYALTRLRGQLRPASAELYLRYGDLCHPPSSRTFMAACLTGFAGGQSKITSVVRALRSRFRLHN